MATIKTQNGKIILKNGKISCSCCDGGGECCMYAVENGYNLGLFTNADLPDEIEVYYSNAVPPELIGPAVATYNGDATWGSFNGGQGPFVELSEDGWITAYAEATAGGAAECLFTDQFNDPAIAGQGRFYLFDRFEDAYTITTPYSSGTVSRVSLCLWGGTDGNGCVLLLRYNDSGHKWQVSFAQFDNLIGCETGLLATKQGNQNTPVGTHTDIAAGVSVTVA